VSTAFDYKVTLVDDQESTCTAGRGRAGTCPEAAAYTLSYRYVTGPAGRETVRRPDIVLHTDDRYEMDADEAEEWARQLATMARALRQQAAARGDS
jgi:hypothetical protein